MTGPIFFSYFFLGLGIVIILCSLGSTIRDELDARRTHEYKKLALKNLPLPKQGPVKTEVKQVSKEGMDYYKKVVFTPEGFGVSKEDAIQTLVKEGQKSIECIMSQQEERS